MRGWGDLWKFAGEVLVAFVPASICLGILTWLISMLQPGAGIHSPLDEFNALDLSARVQFVGMSLAFASLYLAWKSLRHHRRIAILNNRAAAIQHCATRYDDLYKERPLSLGGDEVAVRNYFNRLFGLKSDQLDFYLAGWVDLDTLRSWIYSTYRLISSDGGVSGYSLSAAWRDELGPYHRDANPMFYKITDLMFDAWRARPDKSLAGAVSNAVLVQIEKKSAREREMVQHKYGTKDYFRYLDEDNPFSLPGVWEFVDDEAARKAKRAKKPRPNAR